MVEDTIAAIATALGEASIAVIRVSGFFAIPSVERIFKSRQPLHLMKSHTIQFGHVVSLDSDKILDEVLVTVMKGPRTYTTEDVVEISTHGGIQAVQSVLSELLRTGIRLAEPGEFTKRAFLGGRIDLAQAEGVMELIKAQSDAAKNAALLQVEGSLTKLIRSLRKSLLELLAHIEVTIDYPEHDEEEATIHGVVLTAKKIVDELDGVLQAAINGKMIKDGIRMVLVGRPNVGKSSLLNQLTKSNRAIVTEIPGTTRDIVEERIQIAGLPIYIADTAGIRETSDIVEREGVLRSRQALSGADLLLVVIDCSRTLEDTDCELLAKAAHVPSLVVLNKTDLSCQAELKLLYELVDPDKVVPFSVYRPDCLTELERRIVSTVFSGSMKPRDATFLANSRHIVLLESVKQLLEDALASAALGETLDLLAIDIKQAWIVLGEIIGETPREDLLDQIFKQFCLGK